MNKCQYADYAHHFFSLSHKNFGCYGTGNSQNVEPVGDLCVAGNTRVCLPLNFTKDYMKIMVTHFPMLPL